MMRTENETWRGRWRPRVLAGLLIAVCFLVWPVMPGFCQAGAEPITLPPIGETPKYDFDLADLYMRLHPERYEAEIIAVLYLSGVTADKPVMMRCEGNFLSVKVTSDQTNLSFVHQPPYFWFDNIRPGNREVTFHYRVLHHGLATAGAIIAPHSLSLPTTAYWYPRNVVDDPHQVILNIDTAPGYPLYSNGALYRDIPNNLLRLRSILLGTPSAAGLELRSTP
jgi:hypothetical protein